MNSSGKGSAFERQVCKELGLWITYGARDDIFWRSDGSGSRATTRAKTGRRTANSYGDVAAIDPIGRKLLQKVTIELKRGRSHGVFSDLFYKGTNRKQPFLDALYQAAAQSTEAGTKYWMLIEKPDRLEALVHIERVPGMSLFHLIRQASHIKTIFNLEASFYTLRFKDLVSFDPDEFLRRL